MDSQQKNPLSSIMRQPKIYIRLPSQGNYWAEDSLDASVTGEYPVFSMTAKDELLLKIPDALMNGQAIVDVIQHCMPNIKNAWEVPNIDLDVILIAIRIATYGEKMKIPLIYEGKEFDQEYELDLRYLMAQLSEQITWDDTVKIDDSLILHVKPIPYKEITKTSIQTFETQRILQLADDKSLSDDEKSRIFKDAFKKLNDLTVGIINRTVFKIESVQGVIDNLEFIQEFMENADKEIFDRVRNHIEKLKDKNNLKPIKFRPTLDLIEQGMPDKEIEIPLAFDPTAFFV